jgi:hypothetical protein
MTDNKNKNNADKSAQASDQEAAAEIRVTAQEEEVPNKRPKRHEWLVFKGNSHTRVGRDYQVAVLPSLPLADDSDDDEEDGKEEAVVGATNE